MNELTGAELNEAVAKTIFGWRWLSWIGIPVKGTPGYPKPCRVRQFMSPDAMRNQRWLDFWKRPDVGEVREADGTEPLSYVYCSSQGMETPPMYSGWEDTLIIRWVREHWPNKSPEYEAFASIVGPVRDYEPGDYSRAALTVLERMKAP